MLNPYQIRNAIRDERFFIGRRRELDELMALVTASQPQSVAVIGDRRIGKSSLLQALYRRCRQSDGTVVIYQDVNGLGSSEEVLTALIDNLAVAGHVPTGASGKPLHNVLRHSIRLLSDRARVIILLDEFDSLTGNEKFPITFFNFLRSLANEFPVAMVLAAKRKLKDICHSEEVAGSPFFNIFHERRLGCFSMIEAQELIAGPSSQAGFPLAPFTEEIVQSVGRWPLFVQMMCYWLFETRADRSDLRSQFIVAETRAAEEIQHHISHLWKQMATTERRALIAAREDKWPADIPRAAVDSLVARGLLEPTPDLRFRIAFNQLEAFLAKPESPYDGPAAVSNQRVRVFVSYCHRDANMIERFGILETLRDLEPEGFDVFSDMQLRTGDMWDDVLRQNLDQARILVALVTPDYLRSRYCQDVEIKDFWEGRVKKGLVIFPIIVSPCEWDRHHWLVSTQHLPRKGTLLTDFKGPAKRQELLIEAIRELRSVGERIRNPARPAKH